MAACCLVSEQLLSLPLHTDRHCRWLKKQYIWGALLPGAFLGPGGPQSPHLMSGFPRQLWRHPGAGKKATWEGNPKQNLKHPVHLRLREKAAARMSLAQPPLGWCAVRFEMTFQIFPSLQCLPILIKYVFLPFLLGCGLLETSASVRLELNWPGSSELQWIRKKGKDINAHAGVHTH